MTDHPLIHTYKPLDELIEDFGYLDDWEDRYAYLIDLGKELPGLPEEYKTPEHQVKGCTSQIWLVHHQVDQDEGPVHYLAADSDAFIVRGLVSIVLSAYSGKNRAEIAGLDLSNIFSQIGLERNLSISRRNGFASMIQKVRGFAAEG